MRPTSEAQYQTATTGGIPPDEFVRPRILAVAQPYHGTTAGYTLSYLIAGTGGDIHVIDPGVDSNANWARLRSAVSRLGGAVTGVIVTHLHDDHLGMAARVRRATGARVAMHSREQHALDIVGDGFRADVLLEDGARVAVPGHDLRIIHTPGHTSGSVCVYGHEDGVVFTGDHLLPHQFPGVGLGGPVDGNPLADYLGSLERIESLGELEALPGHEYRFDGSATRCRQTENHHRARTAEVAAILVEDPDATITAIASQLTWSAGWAALSGPHRDSALRQTSMHVDLVGRPSSPRN